MRTTRAHRLPGATGLHVLRCSNLVWCRRSAERLGYGARTLTAALLFLPLAATACPIGWIPSPNTGTCFLVPPERSTSLFRCVDLCNKHGGAPACIGSAEENAFVTAELAASGGLWLGLYQNETGLGPANGWGRCVVGDAPSFTNWSEGQPDHYHGYQQDCAWVDAGTGQWRALACDGGVRFDDRSFGRSFLAELSCLCVHGNASAAFAHDRKALEATSGYNQRLLSRRTAICFSIAAVLALLPTLLITFRLLVDTGLRRLYRRADTESSAGPQGATTVSPSLPAAGATLLSTPPGTASSAMWTSLPLEIRDAIAAHVFGSEDHDIIVGERLQNLLSLADLSPSFVRHAATLKQRSHVSAQAHESATGSGELGSSAPVAARRVGIRLCLATSTDRNVALDSRNYQAVLLLLSKYLLLEYLLTTASRAATPSCSRASRRARPTTTSGPPTSSCPRSTAEPAPTPRSRRWREAHACCGLPVGIRGQA